MHGTGSTSKNYPDQSVNKAEVEKPCYKPLYKSKLFLSTLMPSYVLNKTLKYLASEIN